MRLFKSSCLLQVSIDKLYMSAANHVFEKKMKPLLLEQRKKGQSHGYKKETFEVAKTMMKYIHCIQSPEWAAATAHKITQELPPGLTCRSPTTLHCLVLYVCIYALNRFLLSTGYEKTQSLRFCLALGDTWLKNPNLEVSICGFSPGEIYSIRLKLCQIYKVFLFFLDIGWF